MISFLRGTLINCKKRDFKSTGKVFKMFVWTIALIFFNTLIVACVRNPEEIEYVEKETFVPTLEELKTVLENSLKRNFDFVTVEVVDSPDLTEEPFYLPSSGIGGDPLIFEYGNNDYLLPLVDRSRVYDLIPIIRQIPSYKDKEFFACGAGLGPFDLVQQGCEGIFNLKVNQNGSIDNDGYVVRTAGTGIQVVKVPNNETRAAILGNIFLSEGKAGKLLKVVSRNRTGEDNFINAMRRGLTEAYSQNEIVGLGGAFVMRRGTAFVHVIDDFSETPLSTSEEFINWLTFHEVQAPLITVGNLVSQTSDFRLRLQHFHSYSQTYNQGGHYEYDTTPDIVEYEGYFNVVNRVIIIDKNDKSSAITTKFSIVTITLLIFVVKFFD